MRALLYFAAVFAGALGLVGFLTWPAWELVSQFLNVPFHRVGNRLAMLGLAVGLVLVARRLQLNNRDAMGYGLAKVYFLRQLAMGFCLGLLLMLPLAAVMLALGLRVPIESAGFITLFELTLASALSGITIAFIEETFMRGAMYSAIERESGVLPAVLATAMLFAATHFFARYRIPADAVSFRSGFELVGGSLRSFGRPEIIFDAFISLASVGVLLALVRRHTGNIAACIGLHAGWVTVMLVTRRMTTAAPSHSGAWLISQHDGFVGYLTLAWTAAVAVPLLAYYRKA